MSRWWQDFQQKRPLTDEELLNLVNIPLESEDEFEFNDSGDEDNLLDPTELEKPESTREEESDNENFSEASDNETLQEIREKITSNPKEVPSGSTSPVRGNVVENSKKVIWKKASIQLSEAEKAFLGDTDLQPEILELDSPYRFFNFFLMMLCCKKLQKSRLYTLLSATPTNRSIYK